MDETHKLAQELDELSKKNEPKARVGHKNCIPHIDVFLEDGSTKEEQKIVMCVCAI